MATPQEPVYLTRTSRIWLFAAGVEMRASHRASAALAVSAACVILAVAVIVDRTPGMPPVSLEFIKDMDAPNNLDRAIMVLPSTRVGVKSRRARS